MRLQSYKTSFVNKQSDKKEWFVIDATNLPLGRLATKVALMARGKHKPGYTPHADCGDRIIVLNSNKVRLSGNKWDDKTYIWYTGYPGGQRSMVAKDMNKRKPTALVEKAIRGMLPKTRLGRQLLKNVFVYEGTDHPHQAQKPQSLKLN